MQPTYGVAEVSSIPSKKKPTTKSARAISNFLSRDENFQS
jgi:hypothetical protein